MSHQVFDCGVEHCAVVAQEVAECVDAHFTQAGRAVKVVEQQLHIIKPKFSQLLCTRECFADDQVELGEPAANHGSVLKRLLELDKLPMSHLEVRTLAHLEPIRELLDGNRRSVRCFQVAD